MTPGADAPRPLSKAEGDEEWTGRIKTIPPSALVPQPHCRNHDPGEVRYRHAKSVKALRRALAVLAVGESALARDLALVAASLLTRCPCPSCVSIVVPSTTTPGSVGHFSTGV